MGRVAQIIWTQARRIVLTVLLGGLIGATMVRLAPGFDTDERDLVTGLSRESHEAAHADRQADSNIGRFYLSFLKGLITGDLGVSRAFNRPVTELLRERLPETAVSISYGIAGGMLLGLVLALGTIFWRTKPSDMAADVSTGLLLSIPAAVLGLAFLWTGANGKWAIALLVTPHVYRYAKNLLLSALEAPHVLAARARGVSKPRLLLAHVVTPVAPHLIALCGMSLTIAFSASIPVEVVCDTPGIGQLVWKSALGRDLPLLVNITMLVALTVLVVNAMGDMLIEWRRK